VTGGPGDAGPCIVAEGLAREFDGKRVVDGLDLRVPRGVFFGFLGPNGAGKSTTIRMLTGLLPPSAGSARVLGMDPAEDGVGVRRVVGIVPEEIHTYERLTAHELLVFTGRMHGLGVEASEARAADLLDLVEFTGEDAHRLLGDDSMGTRKKALLAAALIHAPRVLFLDEPFNGIDPVAARAIRGVLQRLVERGVTVFFSSHAMDTVERLCSSAAVIHRGRLVASGTLDEVRAAAGVAPGSDLEEAFVRLVGVTARKDGPAWLS
jgi:ABC-2 type transport system ATP-binding protein